MLGGGNGEVTKSLVSVRMCKAINLPACRENRGFASGRTLFATVCTSTSSFGGVSSVRTAAAASATES
jgi:hypothetical protein